jgi:hypothetical protein
LSRHPIPDIPAAGFDRAQPGAAQIQAREGIPGGAERPFRF